MKIKMIAKHCCGCYLGTHECDVVVDKRLAVIWSGPLQLVCSWASTCMYVRVEDEDMTVLSKGILSKEEQSEMES